MELKIEYVDIDSIKPSDRNAKVHTAEQIEQIKKSIEDYGMNDPIGIWHDTIVEGHGRLMACLELGYTEVPVIRLDHMTDEQRREYMLVHNQTTMNTGYDFDLLDLELEDLPDFDAELYGFDIDWELPEDPEEKKAKKLSDVFGVPPFTILDTRKGVWRDSKKYWMDMGIKSELGRKEKINKNTDTEKYGYDTSLKNLAPATSVFDPFLCELMYKWFCTEGGTVFDCFAGGSVRGIVAEKLGHKYVGIELRQEQVLANRENAEQLGCNPTWICGDSLEMDEHVQDGFADMVFSCPPYADLEVYSEDPKDLSNMRYADFLEAYKKIIKKTYNKLKDDRFAVFVVGEVRDKKTGCYYNFVGDTISAFIEAGYKYYNELVLVNEIGTAHFRARRIFGSGRKNIKVHQNVLVFYKGNPKKIKENYSIVEFRQDVVDDYEAL